MKNRMQYLIFGRGRSIFFAGLLIMFGFVVFPVQAGPGNHGNAGTRDLLIDKLKGVFSSLPEKSPDKIKVGLRLADLHAERGRLQAKKELEKGCIKCTGGKKDIRQSLVYYRSVLSRLSPDRLQVVLVQMGHLHELMNENSEAIELYGKVVDGSQGLLKAEADFSLAEIYFKQRDFKQAKGHYKKALSENSFKRKGLASFRLAWCFYNTGDILKAVSGLEKMLRTPELLNRNTKNLSGIDEDFKAEIARDYTVFMAHNKKTDSQSIEKVFKLSPEKSRIENTSFLAKELERLGQIQQSEQAWELVVKKTDQPQVRVEALVSLANISFKMKKKDKLLSYFKRALGHSKSFFPVESKVKKDLKSNKKSNSKTARSAEKNQAEELKTRLRNIVFDWNRNEEKNPSKNLIMAYEAYLKADSKNAEVFKLASQAATLIKDFTRAYHWNEKAVFLTRDGKDLESLLLRRIEIAEQAGNPKWLVEAQNLYLKKSVTKSKLSEVHYQMAQIEYDKKNYKKAGREFQKLAGDLSLSSKLRLQSAELALDCLVFTKEDSTIEIWGREFAKIFPMQKKHFLKLVGQAVLSQVARLSSDHKKAWVVLNRFNASYADPEQKKTYHKNRIILSRRLNKFHEMGESIQAFLGLGNITDEERRFVLENEIWLNETQLDFKKAYFSYKKLNANDWLKLANLADLAEMPSEKYYFKYLKTAKDPKLAFPICFKLVEKKRTLKGSYKSCVPHLKKEREAFADLIIDIYGKKMSVSALFNQFETYGLEKTWAASVVFRGLLFKKGEKWLKKLGKHKLKAHQLARSVKQRLNFFDRFEKVIGDATQTQDWLVQTFFLSHLKIQYTRFYKDLMALPVPEGLSEEEKRESMTLLGKQAVPYKEKANQIQLKLDELWKDQDSRDRLYADFHRSSWGLQALLGPQIEKLKFVTKDQSLNLLNLIYRQKKRQLSSSFSSLKTAREKVRKSPMDKLALEKLIELETVRGYQPMIVYLNNRLEKLK